MSRALLTRNLHVGVAVRTWHLLASILNASVSARGRYRMGKHCMDYYIGRINPSVQVTLFSSKKTCVSKHGVTRKCQLSVGK